jgi:hypothetical protein
MIMDVAVAVGLQFIRTAFLVGLSYMYQRSARRRSVDGRGGHNSSLR